MLITLPLITFLLLLVWMKLELHRTRPTSGWRESVLAAAVLWGLIAALLTEVLSAIHSLTTAGAVLAWGIVGLATAGRIAVRRAELKAALAAQRPHFDRLEIAGLAGVGIIAAATLLVALLAPPNNWDSMAYHMARVVHWVQQHGVQFYPTPIDRQLHQPPWAEYAIAQFQLLAGSDRFANVVQWASMLGSVLAASLIAADLGVSRRGQVFAALVVAALPIGILEATSTQNDYATAFWLVCVAHYTLDALKRGFDLTNVAGYGGSMALAVFTKGTAYFFGAPFVLAMIAIGLRQLRWAFWKPALSIVALVAAINGPQWWRTAQVYGNPLGPTDLHTVEDIGPPALASNVVRHTLVNAYMPVQSGPVTRLLDRAVESFHSLIGLGKSDPRTTFPGSVFSMPYYLGDSGISPKGFHEDRAGNPLHLLLFLITIPAALVIPSVRRDRTVMLYAGLVLAGFLLFCLLVKWQIFATRLQLPLFVLSAPFAAAVLSVPRLKEVRTAAGAVLLAGALPFLLINNSRPALPAAIHTFSHGRTIYSNRTAQMFTNRPEMQQPYEDTAAYLKEMGCSQIGLVMVDSNSAWEYPLWVLLDAPRPDMRIEYVKVTNETRVFADRPDYQGFAPCALVLLDQPLDETTEQRIGGDYRLSARFGERMAVFLQVE